MFDKSNVDTAVNVPSVTLGRQGAPETKPKQVRGGPNIPMVSA
jgi:hypothetical protein